MGVGRIVATPGMSGESLGLRDRRLAVRGWRLKGFGELCVAEVAVKVADTLA
jgi:hypothetical protein